MTRALILIGPLLLMAPQQSATLRRPSPGADSQTDNSQRASERADARGAPAVGGSRGDNSPGASAEGPESGDRSRARVSTFDSVKQQQTQQQQKKKKNGDSAPNDAVEIDSCRIKYLHRATLASEQAGVLQLVQPKEGHAVSKGDVVARLHDDIVRAELAVAEKKAENDIDIRFARKAAELAKVEVERVRLANKKVPGTIPEIEVERLKLDAERSVLQTELARHEFVLEQLNREVVNVRLQALSVQAPFDGVVVRIFKHTGEAVRQGDPILEIVNPDVLRVEGSVSLQQAMKLQPGDRVEVQVNVPDIDLPLEMEVLSGRLAFIDVDAHPVNGTVRVWAEVTNKDRRVRSGLFARMTVYPGTAPKQKLAAE